MNKKKVVNIVSVVTLIALTAVISGCSTTPKTVKTDPLKEQIAYLNSQVEQLKRERGEKDDQIMALQNRLSEIEARKERKISDLEQARRELEQRLKSELSDYRAKLEMTERGLVLTFLAEIFFNSGQAVIKDSSKETLQKVAAVLKDKVPDNMLAIEGHTDNVPITYSGWESNWELASARALSVLHYFIDECNIPSDKLSAVSYGEYKPVADNSTDKGKKQNRRVEIIVLPSKMTKMR